MSTSTLQIEGHQTIAEIERESRLLCEQCPQYLQLPVSGHGRERVAGELRDAVTA